MNRKSFIAFAALFLLTCLFVGDTAFAQFEKPAAGKATVELKFDKTQYHFGEPCTVEFILKNTDEKNITFSYG